MTDRRMPWAERPAGCRRRRARALLAAVLAGFLLAALPVAGDAVPVSGSVVDEHGEPLAGARVELLPDLPPFEHHRLLLEGADGPSPAAAASTGADGRYELAAPEPGFWVVRASAAGRLPARQPLAPLLAARELAPLALRAGPGITVRVRDERGEPVPGALLAALPVRWLRQEAAQPAWRLDLVAFARTGRDGRAVVPRFPEGATHVEVLAPGHALAAGEAAGASLDLRLAAGTARPVRVLEADGTAAAGALVLLGRLGLPAGRTGEAGDAVVHAPAAGEVLLHARSARGDWTARLLSPPAPPAEAEPAAAPDPAAPATPAAFELRFPPARHVDVRVVDAETGRPVTGALVWAPAPLDVRASAVAAEGGHRLRLPQVAGTPAGHSALVAAAAPGYRRGGTEAAAAPPAAGADAAPLSIELLPERRQRGRVLDAAGEPVAGAQISAWPLGYQGDELRETVRSAADGSFVLAGLAPETRYTVVAESRGLARVRTLIAVPAEGEAEPLDLVLPPGLAAAGRVLDAAGRPVPGATVTLASAGDGRQASLGSMSFHDSGPRGPHRASAGAGGRFRVAGLAAGRYDLAVWADGFAPLRVPGVEVAPPSGAGDEPVDLGTLYLERGEEVAGRVVDPQGEPLAGAQVSMEGAGGPELDVVSDQQGRFTLTGLPGGGSIVVWVHRTGYSSIRRPLGLPLDGPVEVVLHPAAGVAGVVVGPDGEPFEGATVSISVEEGGGSGGGRSLRSGEGGRFTSDVEPGTVRVAAFAEGMSSGTPVRLELGEGQRRDDLRLELSRGGTVQGRITGRGGRPVAGAWIAYGDGMGGRATTDLEGNYRLGGMSPGGQRLRITHREYPPAVRELEVGVGSQTLDVRLDPGAEILVRALDEAGDPVAGARVALGRGGSRSHGGRDLTGADGRFRLRGLEPGRYWVQLSRAGYAPARSEEVEVATGGEVEIDLVMRRGAVVGGRVLGLDPARLGSLEVTLIGPQGQRAGPGVVSQDGTYRVEGATPGEWLLVVSQPPGWADRQVRLTVDAAESPVVADVELGTGHALAGTARLGTTPWSGAQVNVSCPGGHAWAMTDPQGRFQVRDLPAGRCRVRVNGPRPDGAGNLGAELTIELSGDREIEIAPPTPPPPGSEPSNPDAPRGSSPPGTESLEASAPDGRTWSAVTSLAPGARSEVVLE